MNSKCVTGRQSAMSLMRPPSICSQKTFVKTPCINNIKAQSPSNSTVGCKIAWLNSQANEQSREMSINGGKCLTKSKGNSSTALIELGLNLTRSGIYNSPKDKSSDVGKSIATDSGDTQLITSSVGIVTTKPAAGDRNSRLDSKISFSEYLATNENIKKWQEIRTEIPTDEDNGQPESFVQEPWSRLQRLTQFGRGKVLAVDQISQRNSQKNYMENADEAECLRGSFQSYGKQFVQPTKIGPDQRSDTDACQSRAALCPNEVDRNGRPHATSTVENFSISGSLKNRRDVKFLLSAENIEILKRKFEDMNNEDKNEQADSIGSSKERHNSGIRIAKNGKSETKTTRHSDKEQESPQQIESLFFSTLWIQLPIICCFILGLVALLFYFDFIILNGNQCDRFK